MIMDLRTGLANPITTEAKKAITKPKTGPRVGSEPVKKTVAKAPAPAVPKPLDLSKVALGNTTQMASSFKEQFGRVPSQGELRSLIKLRAESKGEPATFQATGGEFDPAQDIASQAQIDSKTSTPDITVPDPEPFKVSDETISSDALGDTDAVSRLSSLEQVEKKFFEDQDKLNQELLDIEARIDKFTEGAQAGLDLVADQAIPMGFITGQQASIERRANRQLETLANLKDLAIRKKELAVADMDTRLKFATAQRLEEQFEMTKDKYQQDQLLGRLELISKMDGTLTDADVTALDSRFGQGFAEKYLDVAKRASEAALEQADVELASDIVGILSKLPEGTPIEIAGAIYSGFKEIDPSKGLHVFTEEDANGRVTQVTTKFNPATSKMEVLSTIDLGAIGKGFKGDTSGGVPGLLTESDLSNARENFLNQNPNATIADFEALSNEEKIRLVSKSEELSDEAVRLLIGSSVDALGNLNASKIPSDIRADVLQKAIDLDLLEEEEPGAFEKLLSSVGGFVVDKLNPFK